MTPPQPAACSATAAALLDLERMDLFRALNRLDDAIALVDCAVACAIARALRRQTAHDFLVYAKCQSV